MNFWERHARKFTRLFRRGEHVLYDLKTLLSDQKLGELCLGASMSQVLEAIGMPTSWEGQPTLTHYESTIWVFGHLQFIFNKNRHIVKIAVHFDDRQGNGNECRDQFSDVVFAPQTTIEQFSEYLSANGISFDREQDEYGNGVIQIPGGVTVAFKRKTDFERSVAEEKRVISEDELLVSVIVQ
ncbi:MAG: hypothetical protein KDB27_09645 [Planctomycetales bacterium]|nr:hypothetical protein [Planctomycetales bacterium]